MTHPDSLTIPNPFSHSRHHGRMATDCDGFLQPSTLNAKGLASLQSGQPADVQFMEVHTNLMRPSGLHHGSIAVINRTRRPKLKDLLAVRFNGDIIMRRLEHQAGQYCFVADDPREPIYYITPQSIIERLGVIIDVIKPDYTN